MARSLNRVQLIGNLTRDPELRYTPQGTAVCTFSVATNRQWKTESGEQKDDAEFHRTVAWDKLAEICGQLLGRGKPVFVEGRLQTRKWQTKEGEDRTTTEIVINDMIIMERVGAATSDTAEPKEDFEADMEAKNQAGNKEEEDEGKKAEKTEKSKKQKAAKKDSEEEEDIPF